MRSASGLFVVAALGNACAEQAGPDAGTVRVTITGFGAGISTAGSATITGASIAPIQIDLPPLATGQAAVNAGTYHVVYAPPAGYTIEPGTPNEMDVEVVAGEITDVEFSVIAANGTLRIVVTGMTAGATNSGSAQVLRTDIVGQTPLAVIVPAGGTVDSSVVPGTYSVTFTAAAEHALVAGQQNPRSLVVASNATASTTFQVQAVVTGPPPAVIFHSNWGTALGTSSDALRDTGKAVPWSMLGGQGLEVISSTGLDFPTPNVLRVTAVAATTGYAFLRKTGMPIPAVGQSRWYRWYFRATMIDGLSDSESHPIQDGNAASDCNWLFHVYHNEGGAGNWRPQVRPAASANAYPNDRWFGPVLSKNITYRFELQIHRTATNTFQMHVRIYNSAGTLLHSDSAFTNQESTANLGSNPTFNFMNLANLEGLNAGNNGIAGSPPWPFVYGYQGAVAVSGADWIGPYAGGI